MERRGTVTAAPLGAAGGSGQAGARDAGPWRTVTAARQRRQLSSLRPGARPPSPGCVSGPRTEEPRAEHHPRCRVWGRNVRSTREEAAVAVWAAEPRGRARREASAWRLCAACVLPQCLKRGTEEKAAPRVGREAVARVGHCRRWASVAGLRDRVSGTGAPVRGRRLGRPRTRRPLRTPRRQPRAKASPASVCA